MATFTIYTINVLILIDTDFDKIEVFSPTDGSKKINKNLLQNQCNGFLAQNLIFI